MVRFSLPKPEIITHENDKMSPEIQVQARTKNMCNLCNLIQVVNSFTSLPLNRSQTGPRYFQHQAENFHSQKLTSLV